MAEAQWPSSLLPISGDKSNWLCRGMGGLLCQMLQQCAVNNCWVHLFCNYIEWGLVTESNGEHGLCARRFESTVQISKLQDLVNRSKLARCRGRFVCPVILYNGKVPLHHWEPRTVSLTTHHYYTTLQTRLPSLGKLSNPSVCIWADQRAAPLTDKTNTNNLDKLQLEKQYSTDSWIRKMMLTAVWKQSLL